MASIRQRHTFIVHSQFRDTADTLNLSKDKLTLNDVPGTRQDRLIVTTDHLKERDILQAVDNIRIEIVSRENFAHIAPFSRQLAWGTHINVVPTEIFNWNGFCKWIQSSVNSEIACIGQESFIEVPYGYYLHSPYTDSSQLLSYIENNYSYAKPDIVSEVEEASTANYISLSLNKNSTDNKTAGRLIAEVYWYYGRWTKTVKAGGPDHRVEVGLLGKIADDPQGELTYGGILAVIGENEQFVPTLFDFSPRHRSVYQPAVYYPDFRQPYGLHPKHLTTVLGDISPPRKRITAIDVGGEDGEIDVSEASTSCGLYGYYVLPNFIFVDKYQVSDLADAQAGGIKRVVGIWGETDLEIPVWMVEKWGSTMLLELIPPEQPLLAGGMPHLDIEIPMHSRYEVPRWNTTRLKHDVPWPTLFWACNSSAEPDMATSPFDSNGLGHEYFFDPGTMFYYLHPNQTISNPVNKTYLVTNLNIPVVPLEAYKYVQPWTVIVILLGCMWIFYKAFLGFRRDGGIRKASGVKPDKNKLEKKGPKTE
ncbi:PIG-X [Lipomyces doorenjongii]|uniref:PIG-X n=1 Tax=Lipomyces doorenjongii TaxID=383834 RepID=UPI0034CEDF3C